MEVKKIGFREKVNGKSQAVFVIFYALDGKPWFGYRETDKERKELVIPTCMMINRWDGTIGFVGGKVDEGYSLEEAIKKEVKEEVGFDLDLKLEEVVAHDIGPITTHAFASQVSYEKLRNIQRNAVNAEDMGSEVTGVFLPHLVDYSEITSSRDGGIVDLYKAEMQPSVREELTHFLLQKEIFFEEKLEAICRRAGFDLETLVK